MNFVKKIKLKILEKYPRIFQTYNLIIDKIASETHLNYLVRWIFYLLVLFGVTDVLISNTNYITFDRKQILNLLVTTISIIVAIIITYLFSKLFSEKAERVQRKIIIDDLSYKLTSFRNIAFQLMGFNSFWEASKFNPKSKIDYNYKWLTYEIFREGLEYEEFLKIRNDIGESVGQAYLGLKGLLTNDSTFEFFRTFKLRNYSLVELDSFKKYIGSFWTFLDRADVKFTFDNEGKFDKDLVDQNFIKIMNRKIDRENFRQEIKDLFSYFDGEIIQKLYYLTSLNSKIFSVTFSNIFFNLLISMIILIVSLIVFSIDVNALQSYLITVFLVGLFIANTFDLAVIIFFSIKKELVIKDFYKI